VLKGGPNRVIHGDHWPRSLATSCATARRRLKKANLDDGVHGVEEQLVGEVVHAASMINGARELAKLHLL
jgi:hypothetical protein